MKFLVLDKSKSNIRVCNRVRRKGTNIYGYKVDNLNTIKKRYFLGSYETEDRAKEVLEDIFEDVFDLGETTYVMPEDEGPIKLERFD